MTDPSQTVHNLLASLRKASQPPPLSFLSVPLSQDVISQVRQEYQQKAPRVRSVEDPVTPGPISGGDFDFHKIIHLQDWLI